MYRPSILAQPEVRKSGAMGIVNMRIGGHHAGEAGGDVAGVAVPLPVIIAVEGDDGRMAVGTDFILENQSEKSEAVALAHGDSERWVSFRQARNQRQGILKSFVTMLMLGTKYALIHFALVFEIAFSLIVSGLKGASSDRRITIHSVMELG